MWHVREEEKCMQDVGGRNVKENLGIDGRVML
jgi:hypothetical protein